MRKCHRFHYLLLLFVPLFHAGCGGGSEPVDPRDAKTLAPIEARRNILGFVQSTHAMLKDHDRTGAVAYCKEMLPTFEGYCEEQDSPHAALFAQIRDEAKAAVESDQLESHLAKIEELAKQLPKK